MTFKRVILYLTPPLLLLTTIIVFNYASIYLGRTLGYFIGFLFYWLFWCLILPLIAIGWTEIKSSFLKMPVRINQMKSIELIMLAIPLLLGYGYAFPRALHSANLIIIITSVPLAITNALLEEILWRTTFIKFFGNNVFMSLIYPTIGFGIWHYSPQTIYPGNTPGGTIAFIGVATVVGLFFGLIARKYKSIFWTTITHALFDFSGLGGRLYFG